MANQSPAAPQNQAPCLAMAINEAPVPKSTLLDCSKFGGDPNNVAKADVIVILKYIMTRLDAGLIEAWNSPWGKGDLSATALTTIEELWARQISEMLVAAAYGAGGAVYLGNPNRDNDIFQRGDTLGSNTLPFFGITAACQQLCTYAAMTRGISFRQSGGGYGPVLNAGISKGSTDKMQKAVLPPSATPTQTADPGSWVTSQSGFPNLVRDDTNPKPRPPVPPKVKKGTPPPPPGPPVVPAKYGVGSCYAWDGSGGPNTRGSHIAFAVRVSEQGDRAQFIDTGGMNSKHAMGASPPLLFKYVDGFTYDYQWTSQCGKPGTPSPPTFSGYGVLPARTDAELGLFTLFFSSAAPMGLCRLLLVWRATQQVIFATPLLRMYTNNPFENFPITRLLFALRSTPGIECIQPVWCVDVPRFEMCEAWLRADRTTALGDIIKDAQTHAKNPLVDKNRVLVDSAAAIGVLDIANEEDNNDKRKPIPGQFNNGTVVLLRRRKTVFTDPPVNSKSSFNFLPSDRPGPFKNLPWDKPSGSIALAKSDFDSNFPYFAGDWDGTP